MSEIDWENVSAAVYERCKSLIYEYETENFYTSEYYYYKGENQTLAFPSTKKLPNRSDGQRAKYNHSIAQNKMSMVGNKLQREAGR